MRCPFIGCDKLVTYGEHWRHNVRHATKLGLIVHFSHGGRLEDIKPLCGAKKSRDQKGLDLCIVDDKHFSCDDCRRALDAWRRQRPERAEIVRTNLARAIAEPGRLQGLRLLAVMDTAESLLYTLDVHLGKIEWQHLPARIRKLHDAIEKARKH
ncbi:hypothetical protein LCGC14_2846020, partial [marine sediment metagenome]